MHGSRNWNLLNQNISLFSVWDTLLFCLYIHLYFKYFGPWCQNIHSNSYFSYSPFFLEKNLLCKFNLCHNAEVPHICLYIYWAKLTRKVLSTHNTLMLKAAAADMRYFPRSKFLGSLVHKGNFGLILQVVFKLSYLFVKGVRISLLSLNEFKEKLKATYCYWLIICGTCFSFVKI